MLVMLVRPAAPEGRHSLEQVIIRRYKPSWLLGWQPCWADLPRHALMERLHAHTWLLQDRGPGRLLIQPAGVRLLVAEAAVIVELLMSLTLVKCYFSAEASVRCGLVV